MADQKIVVVDDDESIRKTFFLILQNRYNVYLAKDPRVALVRFKNALHLSPSFKSNGAEEVFLMKC